MQPMNQVYVLNWFITVSGFEQTGNREFSVLRRKSDMGVRRLIQQLKQRKMNVSIQNAPGVSSSGSYFPPNIVISKYAYVNELDREGLKIFEGILEGLGFSFKPMPDFEFEMSRKGKVMDKQEIAGEIVRIAKSLVGEELSLAVLEKKAKAICDKFNKASKVLEVRYELENKRPGTFVVYFRTGLRVDPYVRPGGGVNANEKFRSEMESECKKAFGIDVDWNNDGSTGWVYLREDGK
jgi:hypothetical protein